MNGVHAYCSVNSSAILMMDLTTKEWSVFTTLPQNLNHAICGLARNPNSGKRQLVVATPYQQTYGNSLFGTPNRVNILDLDTMQWRIGQLRPINIADENGCN